MANRMRDKLALVTGAAQGIGAGIARHMAEEGARVICADLNLEGAQRTAEAIGGEAAKLDVTQEADWSALAARLGERHGRLDVLVNNAGIELVKPLSETSLEEWRGVMAVNVDGIFLGCRSALPLLREAAARGGASVVNISSIAGLVGFPNQPAYNTSKGAVRHMTKSLAVEWAHAGYGIRVNSIHPGCIRTPMLEAAVDNWVREGSIPAENPWDSVANLCPMRMVGEVRDIAMGAVFLGSDESRFVTGIELVIDGGWVAQ